MGLTTTSRTLLEKIKEGDEVSWTEFYNTYAKLIWVCGEDFHLSNQDRKDLIQMVMLEVFRMQPHFQYDRSKGRFRDYMRTIIRRQAILLVTRKRKDQPRPGDKIKNDDDDDDSGDTFDRRWDDEWRSHLIEQALNIMKLRMETLTFQAFVYCVINHLPPDEIATKLGIKVGSVYAIKSRGIAMLKNTIRALEDSN